MMQKYVPGHFIIRICWIGSVIGIWNTQWRQTTFDNINSLSTRRWGCNLKFVMFKLISRIDILRMSCVLEGMPWDLTDDLLTLVQAMAWCRQAASHYLIQCWPSFTKPYGVTIGHDELTHIYLDQGIGGIACYIMNSVGPDQISDVFRILSNVFLM